MWDKLQPQDCLFDLWGVRYCFAKHYNHPVEFHVAREDGDIVGLLALSWAEEANRCVFFPGELWQGKTWLEQNKIAARSPKAANALLDSVSRPAHLRYLSSGHFPVHDGIQCVVDETGYFFSPGRYNYDFDGYMNEFPTRARKKLAKEIGSIERSGIRYRLDHRPDIERLFELNIGAFREKSYFYDPRFLHAFESLAGWLDANGLLRITTLLVGGEVAAVDIGAVWNSCYTVLAGGTHPGFPGAAKIINFQHLRWACRQRVALVDFLCGAFGWKRRFHLQPRPLYLIDTSAGWGAKDSGAKEHEYIG